MKAKREGRASSNLRGQVNAYEKALVMQALKTAKGNQSQAAILLGTSQRIVNYKIQKYGIDTTQFR
jgi:Nif-specific regulatory protein